MCGAIYNVNDHPGLPGLLSDLGYTQDEINEITGTMVSDQRELRPTDKVLSLIPTKAGAKVMPATWWLKLDENTLEPDTRWATFNCQSRRILTSKMHSIAPRSYRSVVFARGFFEWQPVYANGRMFTDLSPQEQQRTPKPLGKQRFLIHSAGEIMMLAALCKHWLDSEGRPLASTGTITLPPHPDFLDIHHKSFPLILNRDELDQWLDPAVPNEAYEELFTTTTYRQTLEAVAVTDDEFAPVGEFRWLRAV
jgi:putative SOS response-associated peptidase YedK